jgi:flagellar hook assembly protein FlgD
LGTYTSTRVSRAARRALVRLLAWRLDVAHVDPLARLTWISGGNPKYPAGTAVRLRAISGHRDTGPTTCPGDALYGQLPRIASRVAARGLPKLYDPEAAGELGGQVRITGRLSNSLSWTVTIRDADGARVARGAGSGKAVDWTWDASTTPYGAYTYTIAAGPDVRPWTDAIPRPPRLVVRRLAAVPKALTPNGDGSGERATISFGLTTAATVTVDVLDDSGVRIRRLESSRSLPRGKSQLAWAGREDDGTLAPDGRYSVRVRASSPGQSASSSTAIVVDRTLGYLAVSPKLFSPNGDGQLEATTAGFELTRQADVRVRVFHRGSRVATVAAATLAAGAHSYPWDGADRDGNRLPDGKYRFRVSATTALGTRVLRKRVRVDTTRPVIRVERAFYRGDETVVRFSLSEAARLRVWYGSPRWSDGLWRDIERDAGERRVAVPGRVGEVRLRGWDAAENRSRAVVAVLG